MTGERDVQTPEFQSCIDTGCDLSWDDHTAEQAERCRAYAMYEAHTDLRTEAEIRDDLAKGDPTARDRLDRREREAARLARFLWPGRDQVAEQEAER